MAGSVLRFLRNRRFDFGALASGESQEVVVERELNIEGTLEGTLAVAIHAIDITAPARITITVEALATDTTEPQIDYVGRTIASVGLQNPVSGGMLRLDNFSVPWASAVRVTVRATNAAPPAKFSCQLTAELVLKTAANGGPAVPTVETCSVLDRALAAIRGVDAPGFAERRYTAPSRPPMRGSYNLVESATPAEFVDNIVVRLIPRSNRGEGTRVYLLRAFVKSGVAETAVTAAVVSSFRAVKSVLSRKYVSPKSAVPPGTTTRTLWFTECEPVVLGGTLEFHGQRGTCVLEFPEVDLGLLPADAYDVELLPQTPAMRASCGHFPLRVSGFRVLANLVEPTDENIDGPIEVHAEWPVGLLAIPLDGVLYLPRVNGERQGGPIAVLTNGVSQQCPFDDAGALNGLAYLLRHLAANGIPAIGVVSSGDQVDRARTLVAAFLWAYYTSNPLIPPPEGVEPFLPPLEPHACFLGHSRGGGAVAIAPLLLAAEFSSFDTRACVGLAPSHDENAEKGGMRAYLAINGSQDGDVRQGQGLRDVDQLSWVGDGNPVWVNNVWLHGGTHGGFFNALDACGGECDLLTCDINDMADKDGSVLNLSGAISPAAQNAITASIVTTFCRWHALGDPGGAEVLVGKLVNPFASIEAQDATLRVEVLTRRNYYGVFFDPGIGADQVIAQQASVVTIGDVGDLLGISPYSVHMSTIAARIDFSAGGQVAFQHQSPVPMSYLIHYKTYDRLVLRVNIALPFLPENDYPNGLLFRVGLQAGVAVQWTAPDDVFVVPPTHAVSTSLDGPGDASASATVFTTIPIPFSLFDADTAFFDAVTHVLLDLSPSGGSGVVLIEAVNYAYLPGDSGV